MESVLICYTTRASTDMDLINTPFLTPANQQTFIFASGKRGLIPSINLEF